MATILRANTDLVAMTWLGGVTGLSPSMVASRLPTDNSTWAASGFITVRAVGGAGVIDHPLRRPIVTIDCWACVINSNKPPLSKAFHLAETVYAAMVPTTDAAVRAIQRNLTLPGSYPHARVLSTIPRTEPRQAYGDQGGYAHVTFDAEFDWIDLP